MSSTNIFDGITEAASDPWTYIGMEASLAAMNVKQNLTPIFSDIVKAVADLQTEQMTKAQSAQAAADLWENLSQSLRSDLTGLREHLSTTQREFADKAIDALQNKNVLDDFMQSSQTTLDKVSSLQELGRNVGGMVAAFQIIAELSQDGPNGTGPTTDDMLRVMTGVLVGILAALALPETIIGIVIAVGIGIVANSIYDLFADNFLSSEYRNSSFWDTLFSSAPTFWDFLLGDEGIRRSINDLYYQAKNWHPPRVDPLMLDLDRDGLELTAVSGSTLFDFNADGIRTGTGWLGKDDGILVRDLNGNGVIDTGREMFGADTLKSNGQFATNGFDALADLDSNHDGQFTAADAAWNQVNVWRDLNQDGVTDQGELFSLDQLGITRISTTGTDDGSILNGNTLAQTGDFTMNGQDQTVGSVDLNGNAFYRDFTDAIPTTAQTNALPDMQGSGWARDLREAATLSPTLAAVLAQYDAATTRDAQMALLDQVITLWAKGSGYWESIEGECGVAANDGCLLLVA